MPNTTTGARLAEALRAEMARQRRSQTELAQYLGISQPAVSRRLNGDTPLDVDELYRIARFLDRPATDFLPVAS